MRYDRFEQSLNRMRHFGKAVSAHKAVSYGIPSPPQHSPESSLMLTGVPVKLTPTKYVRSAGLELPSDPIGC